MKLMFALAQRGFRIPAGATVYGCHWYDHHLLFSQEKTFAHPVTGPSLMTLPLFLTLKYLIPRDGSNEAGTFAPISSLSHLALAGGML